MGKLLVGNHGQSEIQGMIVITFLQAIMIG